MPREYEHRYLIEKLPDISNPPISIIQFYFAYDTSRKLVQRGRMSHSGDDLPKYEVAHKIGKGEDLREVEYDVPVSVFNELQDYFSIGQVIHKTRHHVILRGLKWDVDVYENGMITAELEDPPSWYTMEEFGKSVNLTGNFEYSNYKMSMTGYPEYKHLMET